MLPVSGEDAVLVVFRFYRLQLSCLFGIDFATLFQVAQFGTTVDKIPRVLVDLETHQHTGGLTVGAQ